MFVSVPLRFEGVRGQFKREGEFWIRFWIILYFVVFWRCSGNGGGGLVTRVVTGELLNLWLVIEPNYLYTGFMACITVTVCITVRTTVVCGM